MVRIFEAGLSWEPLQVEAPPPPPAEYADERAQAQRYLEQGVGWKEAPKHWETLRQKIEERGNDGLTLFRAAIFDARETLVRARKEEQLLGLYGTDGWDSKLLQERRRLTSDEAIEHLAWILDSIPDHATRSRLLGFALATYEDTGTGARVTLTVADVVDRTFRRQGKNRTPEGETPWWVLMCDLTGRLGLSQVDAAAITSDVLRWFVAGESPRAAAIEQRWKRARNQSRPQHTRPSNRPSSRWDPPSGD